MDILRTILIIIGILLIAGIYLAEPLKTRWQRWRQHQQPSDGLGEDFDSDEVLGLKRSRMDELPDEWVGEAYIVRRDEPMPRHDLDALKGIDKSRNPLDADLPPGEAAEGEPRSRTVRPPDEVIVMTLMAARGKHFRGPLLLKSLQDAGLVHGDMQIFHYIPEGEGRALFSAANILEPGHFVLSEMVQQETPGIALFMQLPAPLDGEQAWTLMRQRAEQLAKALGGTLCDAQRRPLDEEGMLLLQHQAERFTAVK